MGVFGRLFGTEKAVDNLLDKDTGLLVRAGGWINGLSYTDQERAEGDAKTREWGLRQLEALAPFKVVQRILAFAVAGVWAFVAVNLVISIWVEAATREMVLFNGQQVWTSFNAKTPLMDLAQSDYIFWPVLAVLSLYFTGGVIPHRGQS